MRVLVTGARGFVGRHLAAELKSAGHEVAPLRHVTESPLPGVREWAADICDADGLRAAVRDCKPDACIHLAGIAFVPLGWTDPAAMIRVNTVGAVHVLDAIRAEAPAARTLIVTSALIYGAAPRARAIVEDDPMQPDTIYGVAKMAADMTALLYANHHKLPIMTARPCNHIGPGQSPDFAAPSFARQVAAIAAGRAEPLMKVGNLDCEREFLDVRDVVRAYRLLIEKGQPGRAYNISAGRLTRVREILDILCEHAGVRPRIEIDPARFRPTDAQAVLNPERLHADTGWSPRLGLRETLADVLAEFRAALSA